MVSRCRHCSTTENSQAIDKGSNQYAYNAGLDENSLDLAGNPRFSGNSIDIGAYEYQETGPILETPSIIVTTLDDVVDAYDGQISLREAIFYANAGDTITFAENLSGGTITLNGEQLAITKDLIITTANLENGITIDANQKSRVFSIVGCDVTLVGLTITGGNATNGGGIYMKNAVLSLMDSEVIGNKSTGAAHSTSGGGGIYSDGGSLMINQTLIANNTSTSYGAGIYLVNSKTSIEDSTINGNASTTSAGGLFVYKSLLRMDGNVMISSNTAVKDGAGLFMMGANSVAFITGATFEGNRLSGGLAVRGAGIFMDSGRMFLSGVAFTGNISSGYGAGIYQLGGELTVADNTRFENNTSTSPLITKGNNIHSMSVNAKTHVSETTWLDDHLATFLDYTGSTGSIAKVGSNVTTDETDAAMLLFLDELKNLDLNFFG